MRLRLAAPLLLALVCSTARGQDFRVYTVVRDLGSVGAEEQTDAAPIVARSLTLFRARKSYDWLEEVGEVVLTDRTHGRVCVIDRELNGLKLLDEERRHFVKRGRTEADSYLRTIDEPGLRQRLRFTIDPAFEMAWQPEIERLSLVGEGWRYDIETAAAPDEAYTAAYLDYADAACEINFLLHPHTLYPAMRQAVNARLRELGRLPLAVTLQGDLGRPLHLRAEHKYEWTLQSYDRSQIRRWEQLAETDRDRATTEADAAESVQWRTVHEFQKVSLRP